MTETRSRGLLALEAAVICLPLTALFVVLVLPSSLYFATHQTDAMSILSAGTSVVILATWICAWWLIGGFLLRGTAAFRTTALYWWVLPFGTGALSCLATLYVVFSPVLRPRALNIFAFGLPCIVPLAHLSWERWAPASR